MKRNFFLLALLIPAATLCAAQARFSPRVESLLDRMTIDEMIGQLNLQPYYESKDSVLRSDIAQGRIGALLKADGAALNRDLQTLAISSSRLGIPLMFHEDVIHGYRTIYPIPLAEACSWDIAGVEENSRNIAREAVAAGLQLTYAPMVDICCDPRWGRIMETSGEDPYLSAEMAAARVRGFQKEGLQSCVKHFAGYASMKDGIDYRNEEFSPRDLEEIYLPPYRACVREGVGSFMCSYTMYDGVPATHSRFLNTDILRGELGYEGLLMTDWSTLSHAYAEGAATSKKESAEKGINSGIDMDMTSGYFVAHLKALYEEGAVSLERIREAAGRALELKEKAELFDNPFRGMDPEVSEIPTQEQRACARKAASSSMVLLKNSGILPLKPRTAVSVQGPFADAKADLLGSWKCKGEADEVVSVLEAARETFKVHDNAEIAIVCIGESASLIGEAHTSGSLEVEEAQVDLLRSLKARGKTVVGVLFNGRPLCLGAVEKECDALLEAWYPGTEGGHAVVDILSGRTSPSGKLVQSFPRNIGQVPLNYYPRRTFQKMSHYGIEDGALYPFGYGLSYTTFEYSSPETSKESYAAGDSVDVSITVRNAGAVAGDEIVELYVSDEVASIIPREKMLKAFKKIHLEAGESRRITFTLDDSAFSIYSSDHIWKVEPGWFKILVGPSSTTTDYVRINISQK